MVIFGLSGSLRKGSSNTALLQTLKSLAPAGTEFIFYENLASLPHFNPDLDGDQPPEAVKELRGMLNRSSAVVISTPEYAHGIPGSLKNALDWLVSTTVLTDKPVGLMMGSTSEGQYARDALVEVLKTMNARVPSELLLTIPGAKAKSGDVSLYGDLRIFVENLILSARKSS